MALNGERPMGHGVSGAGPRRITILGATGSIGTSTLDLIRRNPEGYAVEALTANSDWKALAARLVDRNTRFIIEPGIRFEGLPGEQATFFFKDPSGNALEFKAFQDEGAIFAR